MTNTDQSKIQGVDISIENFSAIYPLLKYKLSKAGFRTILDLVIRGALDIREAAEASRLKKFDL